MVRGGYSGCAIDCVAEAPRLWSRLQSYGVWASQGGNFNEHAQKLRSQQRKIITRVHPQLSPLAIN